MPLIVRDGALGRAPHGTTGAPAATLNLVVVAHWSIGWMHTRRVNMRTLGVGTVVGCSALVGLEHLERQNFAHRITKMQIAQDSWVKTWTRWTKSVGRP